MKLTNAIVAFVFAITFLVFLRRGGKSSLREFLSFFLLLVILGAALFLTGCSAAPVRVVEVVEVAKAPGPPPKEIKDACLPPAIVGWTGTRWICGVPATTYTYPYPYPYGYSTFYYFQWGRRH